MPTFIAAYQVNSAGVDQTTLVSPTFTPAAGEVLVVKGYSSHGDGGTFPTPTGGGLTYVLRQHDESASHDRVAMWTTVVPSGVGQMAVSLGSPGAVNNRHMLLVERWFAQLAATPASVLTTGVTSAPSTTITTTQAGSVVSWMNSDWNAIDGSGRTYNTSSATPVEDGFLNDTGNGVHYSAYQQAAIAGSQTFGLTAPGGQNWTLIGVELLDLVPGRGTTTATGATGSALALDASGKVTIG